MEEASMGVEVGGRPYVIKAVPHPSLHQAAFVSGIAQVTVLGVEQVVERAQHESLNELRTVHALPLAYRVFVQDTVFGDD